MACTGGLVVPSRTLDNIFCSNRHELAGLHWLQHGQVGLPHSGEGNVGQARRRRWAVQPHQEMLQILALRLADGPGVGWSEGIPGHVALPCHVVGDWVDEGPLVVGELDYQRSVVA